VKLLWSDEAWDDYQHWRKTNIPIWKMVKALIRHIAQRPYTGLGRPKALQYELKGYWSRRINEEHRLVYRIRGRGRKQVLEILQCRGHY
jgi:toxin YoeB